MFIINDYTRKANACSPWTSWSNRTVPRNISIKFITTYHKSLFITTWVNAKLYQWEKRNRSSCSQIFFKIVVLFTISTRKPLRRSLFLQTFRPVTLLKTDSNTDAFFLILQKCLKTTFYRTILVAVSEQIRNHDTFFK